MKPSHLGAIIIGFCSLISFNLYAASIEAGKTKSALCAGCHGQDGNSVNAIWPKLAGQHASYLTKQIREFKDGTRVDPVMKGMVAALTDDDIADIDPDPVDDLPVFRDIRVALAHGALHLGREEDGVDHTAEFHQLAVAHQLDCAPVVLCGLRFEQLFSVSLERG